MQTLFSHFVPNRRALPHFQNLPVQTVLRKLHLWKFRYLLRYCLKRAKHFTNIPLWLEKKGLPLICFQHQYQNTEVHNSAQETHVGIRCTANRKSWALLYISLPTTSLSEARCLLFFLPLYFLTLHKRYLSNHLEVYFPAGSPEPKWWGQALSRVQFFHLFDAVLLHYVFYLQDGEIDLWKQTHLRLQSTQILWGMSLVHMLKPQNNAYKEQKIQ